MKKTLLFLLFSIITTAQSLDPTFDTDGLVNNPISTTPSIQNAYDGILQPDGKMIYVGRYFDGTVITKGFIVRFNTDGTKDTSFATGGISIFGVNGFQSVTLQADGKILVAGTSSVYRLTANGIVDTSFNSIGYKTISLSGQNMNMKCVSVQSDNKIVVSGFISNGTNNDVAVARLNTDGTFDTTFDTDGIYTFISSSIDNGFTHKIQADGKIVIVGDTGATTAAKNFLIVRLNINGTLDTTFNLTGYAITDFSSSVDYARDIQILPDNSILVLGSSAGNVALAKYTTSGALDTSFNTTGKKTFTIISNQATTSTSTSLHYFSKFSILPTGEVIISCTNNGDYTIVKLNTAYNLDTTFGTNGIFTSNSEADISTILQIKPNGNIITGGISFTTALNSDAKIKEVEIASNGTLINSVTKNLFLGVDKFISMNKNANGDIFVLANTPNPTLFKYNSSGQLDVTFGVSGKVILPDSAENDCKINIFSDKIFVYLDFGIYKFNSNGTLDTSFDTDGYINMGTVLNSFNNNYSLGNMDDVKIDAFGNLIVAIDIYITGGSINYFSMGVLKFLNNGLVDVSFGNNGLFTTRFNSDLNFREFPQNIILQNDGKIKILGQFHHNQNIPIQYTFCSFRINSNGVLDTAYGNNGKTTNTFPSLINWPINSFIFSDNSVLCFMKSQNNSEMKSIKFLADGAVDLSHGTNGISNDFVGSNNSTMVFQPDGKYLKAGSKNNHFSISRYNADGSVDTSFGTNGELNPIVGYASSISDILLQADGKIVVGGTSTTSDNQLAVIARFTNTILGTLDFSSSKNTLSIYPNPIETSATFEFTLNNSENINIELYDIQGKLVQTIANNQEYSVGNHKLPIELPYHLNSGNYLLKLSTQNGSQSIQIIKK